MLPTDDHPVDPLHTALARKRADGAPGTACVMRERCAPGLQVSEVVCTSGPSDRPFDEQHAGVSIAAVLAGTFAYTGEHGRSLMTPGALLLGNADAGFRCSHEHGEGDRCLAFHFDPAAFERLAADAGVRHTRFRTGRLPPSAALAPLMAEAELAFERNEALDEAALSLAAAVLRASHESRSPVVTMRDEHRAAGIARLLESTFVRHHSLATLAAQAGISPFHFLRVFRKATGATPRQFLLRLRLRAAVRLLRTTPMRVTDIAYAVGFGDLSHFVRSFRAEFGVAPSRARQPGWSQREIMVRSSAPTLNLSL